jgi:hypothetical protein
MRRGHHSDHDDILRDGERLHVIITIANDYECLAERAEEGSRDSPQS